MNETQEHIVTIRVRRVGAVNEYRAQCTCGKEIGKPGAVVLSWAYLGGQVDGHLLKSLEEANEATTLRVR